VNIEQFPKAIRPYLIPEPKGEMVYRCLGCQQEMDASQLHYTCPDCGSVFLLYNKNHAELISLSGSHWRMLFDYRKMLNHQALKGIFRYYEFIAPVIPLDDIIYLGEGDTPLVKSNNRLQEMIGIEFYFKNDGLNPSASFKDRGMACALSYINHLAKKNNNTKILSICASTGDTSASAALYASYLGDFIKSAVILPQGKVTPQQLSQPLGSGAKVFEIPGVFDDCMKVVESLAEKYQVALLNSKNSWRILGQESFAFEISQDFDYQIEDKAVIVPIGNAGNITAIMNGFLKFFEAGIINSLPKIIGVQSEHADPVYHYYKEKYPDKRKFVPVTVRPSVAQAAMIGNPVSMPRVIELVNKYNQKARKEKVFVVQVTEQEIMDCMIIANRNGNIICTQGGESMAGLKKAVELGHVKEDEVGILNSTAHIIKFASFQEMYFNNSFGSDFEVHPREDLKNAPKLITPSKIKKYPEQGHPLEDDEMKHFIKETAADIAKELKLDER